MAKQKIEKVVSSVEFKDPNQVIYLRNLGFKLTSDNLTLDRYNYLISLSNDYAQYFNVKLTPKQNETEMES